MVVGTLASAQKCFLIVFEEPLLVLPICPTGRYSCTIIATQLQGLNDPESMINDPNRFRDGKIALVFLWVTMQQRLHRNLGCMRAGIMNSLIWRKAIPSLRYYVVLGLEELTTMCSLDQTSWCWEYGFLFAPIGG